MKIGIMGGTFNPIHNGHLILSQCVKESLNLDRVIFLPSGQPPHKNKKEIIGSQDRKNMVDLAIGDNPGFTSSDLELKKEKLSYTVDSISELKKMYKEDDLYLILGGDSLMTIESWKDYESIIKEVRIAVVKRLGYDERLVKEKIRDLNIKYKGKIYYVDCPIIEISSTDIRNRIKEKKSIKYYVPKKVENYIYKKNIYRG